MKDSQKKTEGEFKIPANWAAQSKALKSKFSQLTDEDLMVESGRENEMIYRVETRLNKNRQDVLSILSKSQSSLD